MARRMGFALSVAGVVALTFVISQAESHVRIVRLSYIDGQVQMQRSGDQALDRAILNAPIVEGMRLVTGANGLAEVEFENRSSLRLADNSDVEFKRLLMNDAGAKINEIAVTRGIVYLNVEKSDDVYRIVTHDSTFLARKGTEMRVMADDAQTRLAVFKGEVEVENQAQPLEVKKKQSLTLTADNSKSPVVVPGVDSISYDAWNNERAAYTSAYTQSAGSFGSGPVNGYGLQDLNYYGNFFYAPGFGYAWQPYGISGLAGWNPYMGGAWMFNQGLGYSFVSAYPWGWLPYHYGAWSYVPNVGWAWLPGSGSTYKGGAITTAFRPVPTIAKAPAGFVAATPPVTATARVQTVLASGFNHGVPAAIPGGRPVPNFRSVLPVSAMQPTRSAATGSTFVKNSMPVNNVQVQPHSAMMHPGGHVFAAPAGPVSRGEPGFGTLGAPGAPGMAAASPVTHGSTTAGHSTGGNLHH